jgi:hypothetical protein
VKYTCLLCSATDIDFFRSDRGLSAFPPTHKEEAVEIRGVPVPIKEAIVASGATMGLGLLLNTLTNVFVNYHPHNRRR